MDDKPRKDLRPLTISLAISMAPHIIRLPWWIIIWCLFFLGYSYSGHGEGLGPKKRKWILLAFTIAGIVGVLSEYRTVLGQTAGVGLICVMASLKLLEVKSVRDKIITVFVSFFVIITNLLFSTSIFITIHMFFAVFVSTSVLVFYTQPGLEYRAVLKTSGSLLSMALPIMVILFVFFPRIQGTLWKGFRVNSGYSGFSDTLTPGSVIDMAVTGDVAFRAEFSGKRPAAGDLYWKGIVYGFFDGRSWKKSLAQNYSGYRPELKAEYDYTITMEPNNSRYMFVSGCPVKLPDGTDILTDGTIRSRSMITDRLRYRILSEESCHDLKKMEPGPEFIILPRAGNILSVNQGKRWRKEYSSEEQIVSAALDFFKTGGYTYSLAPPQLLTEDQIDEFLFSTKKGYCEHYASSFAFLMRAAGIPARVVGGYMGGDINPVGGHMTVTQDKAHAWVEIFLEKKGWTLADPTAALAPDRFTRGLSSVLPSSEMPVILKLPDNRFIGWIWKKTSYFSDYMNHGWNKFIIGYTYRTQKGLYDFLGLNPGKVSGALFIVFIILFSCLSVILLSWRLKSVGSSKDDPLSWAWIKFCDKFESLGIKRDSCDGPLDFFSKMEPLKDENRKKAELIVMEYIRLRYASRSMDRKMVSDFLGMVRRFRPLAKKKSK